MKNSYEFKKECVQLYRGGKCADISEGKQNGLHVLYSFLSSFT